MSKLFISHSSHDDECVRNLREALADQGQDGWIDSRELRGGDPLLTDIKRAIEESSAFAVVVSTDLLQSTWVGKELRYALKLQAERGKDKFPIIPLSLNGTKLGVLEEFFGEEPLYIPFSSDAGGVEAAMNAILVALRKRDPADVSGTPQPKAQPLEELVLELTDLKFQEQDGIRRPTARARLVYQPATPGQREVATAQPWRLIAPLGPIEAGEMKWYLEQYAIWPSHYFRDRARKVEENLAKWGKLLHEAAMPVAHREEVMKAWETTGDHAGRRFSVHVDVAVEAGAPEADVKAAQEAATLLLGLPWELLHDGKRYLFQGAKPTRVRRTLPGTESMGVAVVAPPIRILLVTARPEDESCGYIDHRVSALPLVEAMESLPGLVKLQVLSPPTLPALRAELDRARDEQKPYHVVHFDGHGVYDKTVGLGGLCFELPEDIAKLEKRRHATVFTNELGPLLRDHRIPLVFLEACQTATAEKASESVASELLKVGVASVVAMSHSVLVETARRFVAAFYQALAAGKRVGDAMLAGQRELEGDKSRGRMFGLEELQLHDWFVPVLFQEKDDPQLFKTTPAKQTVEDFKAALANRLGELPPPPETGFVGRSRELLALQRLLRHERYAVVRGQGGEGKTALAGEFARWMVRSQQMRRAVFVSVETHSHVAAVLDAIGSQLVGKSYSVAAFDDVNKAFLPIERELREQSTLLVVDNMESVLLPTFIQEETPEALSDEAREELAAILKLCERLVKVGETRIVFTSREALPAPFDLERHRRELGQLHPVDAVKLIERVLNVASGGGGGTSDADRVQIDELVSAVHCHARTLALLAPALRSRGVKATRESLVELMAEMEKRFPGSREQSVFASVELSLQRMSEVNRDKARVLGVFHGGLNLAVLKLMMQWEDAEVVALAGELIGTGLATLNRYNHLTLNPALCPYLRGLMERTERESLTARWVGTMRLYAEFLARQHGENTEIAATLTILDLQNLFVLLDLLQRDLDAEATIDLVGCLYVVLQWIGKPRLVERLGRARDSALSTLSDAWNHARFSAAQNLIQQQLGRGQLREALAGAQQLYKRAQLVGKEAYIEAYFDLAAAGFLLARLWIKTGNSDKALPLLEEAQRNFTYLTKVRLVDAARNMVPTCISERAKCFRHSGRFDDAITSFREAIRQNKEIANARGVAVDSANLGNVFLQLGQYSEALVAYEGALDRFTKLNELGSVGATWHSIGSAYQQMGKPESSEDAFRKSLAISIRLGNVYGQATTLAALGIFYADFINRPEEAVTFYRQACDKYIEMGDEAGEGLQRDNLADLLLRLRRLDDARQEILRAIECKALFGHVSQPWKTWAILAEIETDAGNPAAASEAKGEAIACYLAYRRDGGENHDGPGRICLAMTQPLLAGDTAAAASLLEELAANPDRPARLVPIIRVLQAIVDGSRDHTLADAPDLHYTMAAEILFLIETLQKPQ